MSRRLITAALLMGALAAPAQAAPGPVRVTVPLELAESSGPALGKSSLRVTYTRRAAKAVAAAPAVSVPAGDVFRIAVCVQTHVYRGGNVTRCSDRTVDTTDREADIVVAGPELMVRMARPAARWAYAYHQVAVRRRGADGRFWPFAGTTSARLSRSAISIVPRGERRPRPLPSHQGLEHRASVGGMNTGNPDSICMSDLLPEPPLIDVSTTALGTAAPAYYEVGEPTGAFAGTPPKGVMLLIHGGGWAQNGPGAAAGMRQDAERWRARGWRTLNASHRPCERAMQDVRWFYDRARELWGPDLPYCAMGESSGAHLALMLAAQRATLACAISEAGPSNPMVLDTQGAYDPPTGGTQTTGPHWLYNLLTAAFGEERLPAYSPALLPISARVLAAFAEHDHFVPIAQGDDLRERMLARDPEAYVDLAVLPSGTTEYFGHAWVSQEGLDDLYAREELLVAPLVSG